MTVMMYYYCRKCEDCGNHQPLPFLDIYDSEIHPKIGRHPREKINQQILIPQHSYSIHLLNPLS